MMPKLKYFVQCDHVQNDNGKISAVGLFDTIFALIYPATHRRMFFLMGFVGGQGEFDLQVLITAPDGQGVAEVKGKLASPVADRVSNAIFALENLVLPVEGRYTVSVFLAGDFLVEHHFFVQSPTAGHQRTPEQIVELLGRDDIVKAASVEVGCERCRSVYRFQHHLDPDAKPEPGFLRLPPGDVFNCGSCGNRISIALLRRNLENIVGIPRQWVEPPQAPPDTPAEGGAQA